MTKSQQNQITNLIERADRIFETIADLTRMIGDERADRMEADRHIEAEILPEQICAHQRGCLQIRKLHLVIVLLLTGTTGAGTYSIVESLVKALLS